jgi:hypothetical protein
MKFVFNFTKPKKERMGIAMINGNIMNEAVEAEFLRKNSVMGKSDSLLTCPCRLDEVYSFGVSLHHRIGEIYSELAAVNQGAAKMLYTSMALRELYGNKEMEEIIKTNINNLLFYFYDNGGPVIENPVSEQLVSEVKSFYKRIMISFWEQVDIVVDMTFRGKMNANELEIAINNCIIFLYTAMGKLFQDEEIKKAINDLIDIRKSSRNN